MSFRINGLSTREITSAANRSGVKGQADSLIRFAAEVSGKALSHSKSFDWQAGLARMQQSLNAQLGPVVTKALVAQFMGEVPKLNGLNVETVVIDEAAALEVSDGGNCD